MKKIFLVEFFNKFLILCLLFVLSQSLQADSLKIQRWQTAKGVRVIFYQAMEVPMLDINIAFVAGSAYDGKQFGKSALTTQLINQGNGSLDATKIAEKLADIGAQYSSEASRDRVILSLKTLTKPAGHLQQAIDTFTLIINKPDFPEEAFNREKNQQLQLITQSQESPEDIANQILFKKLYQAHPYGHPINGTKETVSALERRDIQDFYKNYFVSANAVVVMVGAIEQEKAHQIADQLTADLPLGQPAPAIPKAAPLTASEKIALNFPATQTVLRIGQIGIDYNSPDYFALTVGNYILGGGALVSRLANEVREKRGLTYEISSQLAAMPGNGPFIISFSTENKEAANALKITQDTLTNFVNEGPSEKELAAAKQFLMGSFPLSLASNTGIANMLLRIALNNLANDYLDTYVTKIHAVTTAEITRAFQKLIHPDKMVVVTVGGT
jgi:zinc protease